MIRVLLADDHALVRRGLRQLLEELSDVEIVGEVADGGEVADAVRRFRPDVLLLDISMPGGNFLDLLGSFGGIEPRMRTVVVSTHSEVVYARRAIRAGAAGYVAKASSDADLVTAVRVAARGGRYVSPSFAQELACDLAAGTTGAPHERLTNREFQVLLLLAAGNSVSEIAKMLSLSVKTISTHRSRLLAKMDMTTNAELVRYALAHALIA